MKTKSYKLKTPKTDIPLELALHKDNKKAIILANGAGGKMDTPFMQYFFEGLAAKYSVVRFNYIYQTLGRKAPDRAAITEETYSLVLQKTKEITGLAESKIVLSGKSMGGRIGSQIAANTGCKKLFFLGYPLHAPGRSDKIRDAHLYELKAKMLFLSGDRDSLCDLTKLNKVLKKLPQARLYKVADGDHSFKVRKKSGLDQDVVMADCLKEIIKFVGR